MSAVRPVLSVLLLFLTALGLHNVYADHSPVLEKAKAAACKTCEVSLSQMTKSPVAHTYVLTTAQGTAIVECQRPYIFLGEYVCEMQSP